MRKRRQCLQMSMIEHIILADGSSWRFCRHERKKKKKLTSDCQEDISQIPEYHLILSNTVKNQKGESIEQDAGLVTV